MTDTDDVQLIVARAHCYSNTAQAALDIAEGNVRGALRALGSTQKRSRLTKDQVVNHLAILRQSGLDEAKRFYDEATFPEHERSLMESDLC